MLFCHAPGDPVNTAMASQKRIYQPDANVKQVDAGLTCSGVPESATRATELMDASSTNNLQSLSITPFPCMHSCRVGWV
jgi:hypothetical protein